MRVPQAQPLPLLLLTLPAFSHFMGKGDKALSTTSQRADVGFEGKKGDLMQQLLARINSIFQVRGKKYDLSPLEVQKVLRDLKNDSFQFRTILFRPKPNKPGKLRPITKPHKKDIIVMHALSEVLS